MPCPPRVCVVFMLHDVMCAPKSVGLEGAAAGDGLEADLEGAVAGTQKHAQAHNGQGNSTAQHHTRAHEKQPPAAACGCDKACGGVMRCGVVWCGVVWCVVQR